MVLLRLFARTVIRVENRGQLHGTMKYRRLKPNERVRKTDQLLLHWLNGEEVWGPVCGHDFKVEDCMSGNVYRRRVEYGTAKRHKV